jgi:hypothetical protein
MALPLKDTKINTGLTSLDIGPVSDEYEYINNYLKETDEDDLYNEYGYPKTAFAIPLLGKLGLDFATLKKIWKLNNALEVTGKVGRKVKPIIGGIFTSKGAQAKVPPKITRDVGLGDAGIAEVIAAQNRAEKKAAIQEAVNIQIGTSRGGQEQSGGSAQGGGGGPPGGEAGWKGARGGYVDRALRGRSRYL